LALLGEIMSWPKVGMTGNGEDEMSFKSCYMGLIGVSARGVVHPRADRWQFLTSSVALNSLAKGQVK